jgi:hypothetical protein
MDAVTPGVWPAPLSVPENDENDDGPATPVGSPGQSASRRASASRRPPAGTDASHRRRTRGLLVTPWFAAGAGFVIAAALALNSPHTVLTYRPNTTKCRICQPAPSLATAKPGVKLKTGEPAKRAKPEQAGVATGAPRPSPAAPAAPAGPAVDFRVVWQKNGAFGAVITLPGGTAPSGWSLRFEIPDAKILRVLGARWQPAAGDHGGLVTALSEQASQPGPGRSGAPHGGRPGPGHFDGPGPPGPEHSGSPGEPSPQNPREGTFFVVGNGTPVTPVDCLLDGATCHFD